MALLLLVLLPQSDVLLLVGGVLLQVEEARVTMPDGVVRPGP